MTDSDFSEVLGVLRSLWPKMELDNDEWLRIWRQVVDPHALQNVMVSIRSHAANNKFPLKPSELCRYLAPDAPSEDPNPKHGRGLWDTQRAVWISQAPERKAEFEAMSDLEVEEISLNWVWERQKEACGPESLGAAIAYWQWQDACFRAGHRQERPPCSAHEGPEIVKPYLKETQDGRDRPRDVII